jgi:hypothetical protein
VELLRQHPPSLLSHTHHGLPALLWLVARQEDCSAGSASDFRCDFRPNAGLQPQARVIRGNNVCRCQGSDRPSTLLSPPIMTLLLGDIWWSPYLRQLWLSLFSGSEHIQVPKYLRDAHWTCNVEPSLSASWAIRAGNWATVGQSHPLILPFDNYCDIWPAAFGQSEKVIYPAILPPIVLCHAEEGFSVPLRSVPDTEIVPCR